MPATSKEKRVTVAEIRRRYNALALAIQTVWSRSQPQRYRRQYYSVPQKEKELHGLPDHVLKHARVARFHATIVRAYMKACERADERKTGRRTAAYNSLLKEIHETKEAKILRVRLQVLNSAELAEIRRLDRATRGKRLDARMRAAGIDPAAVWKLVPKV